MNPGDLDMSSLHNLGHVTIYDQSLPSELVARALQAEIVITNKCIINSDILDQLPKLKYIQVAATGYNNIDLQACKEKNIIVANVSGYSTSSVAQHVFAMLLEYHNSIAQYTSETRAGVWPTKQWTYWHNPIEELHGKQFGIVGLGTIGKAVKSIALAFGMEVLSPSRGAEKDIESDVTYLYWKAFLQTCDYITLHCPLNDTTHHLMDKKALKLMKANSVLINTSRGPVIDEEALYHALTNDTIKAALLDVLSNEPPSSENILLPLHNCHITPHQAWGSKQARERLLDGIVLNITDFISGRSVASRIII